MRLLGMFCGQAKRERINMTNLSLPQAVRKRKDHTKQINSRGRDVVRWCQSCGARSDKGARIIVSGLERLCWKCYPDKKLVRRIRREGVTV